MAARKQETLWSHFPRQQRKREATKSEQTRESAAALASETDGSPTDSSGAVTPTDHADDEAMERECGETVSINQIVDDISRSVVVTPERPLKRSKLMAMASHPRYSPRTASTLLHGKKEVCLLLQGSWKEGSLLTSSLIWIDQRQRAWTHDVRARLHAHHRHFAGPFILLYRSL